MLVAARPLTSNAASVDDRRGRIRVSIVRHAQRVLAKHLIAVSCVGACTTHANGAWNEAGPAALPTNPNHLAQIETTAVLASGGSRDGQRTGRRPTLPSSASGHWLVSSTMDRILPRKSALTAERGCATGSAGASAPAMGYVSPLAAARPLPVSAADAASLASLRPRRLGSSAASSGRSLCARCSGWSGRSAAASSSPAGSGVRARVPTLRRGTLRSVLCSHKVCSFATSPHAPPSTVKTEKRKSREPYRMQLRHYAQARA